MMTFPRGWRRPLAHLVGGLALPLALALESPAQTSDPAAAAQSAAPAPAGKLSLAEAVQLALGQQPNVRAAQASLAAAEAARHGVYRLPTFPLLPSAREVPVRRKQADIGLTVAHAALEQA